MVCISFFLNHTCYSSGDDLSMELAGYQPAGAGRYLAIGFNEEQKMVGYRNFTTSWNINCSQTLEWLNVRRLELKRRHLPSRFPIWFSHRSNLSYCSSRGTETPELSIFELMMKRFVLHYSFNFILILQNIRKDIISDPISKYENGMIYCSWKQKVGPYTNDKVWFRVGISFNCLFSGFPSEGWSEVSSSRCLWSHECWSWAHLQWPFLSQLSIYPAQLQLPNWTSTILLSIPSTIVSWLVFGSTFIQKLSLFQPSVLNCDEGRNCVYMDDCDGEV